MLFTYFLRRGGSSQLLQDATPFCGLPTCSSWRGFKLIRRPRARLMAVSFLTAIFWNLFSTCFLKAQLVYLFFRRLALLRNDAEGCWACKTPLPTLIASNCEVLASCLSSSVTVLSELSDDYSASQCMSSLWILSSKFASCRSIDYLPSNLYRVRSFTISGCTGWSCFYWTTGLILYLI